MKKALRIGHMDEETALKVLESVEKIKVWYNPDLVLDVPSFVFALYRVKCHLRVIPHEIDKIKTSRVFLPNKPYYTKIS